jgi:hypothetical protein
MQDRTDAESEDASPHPNVAETLNQAAALAAFELGNPQL